MPLKDITNRILFVLAGNKYVYQIIFDGSYFVPYFTCSNLQQKNVEGHVVLLVCMECCQGSSRLISNATVVASRKRVQRYSKFLNHKNFPEFFFVKNRTFLNSH